MKYLQSFPGASSFISNAYEIHLNGDPDDFLEALDTLRLFSLIEKYPYMAVAGCANPYSVNDPQVPLSWNYDVVEVECAWNITTGNPNIIVGVVDIAFELTHDDLENKIVSLWEEVPGCI